MDVCSSHDSNRLSDDGRLKAFGAWAAGRARGHGVFVPRAGWCETAARESSSGDSGAAGDRGGADVAAGSRRRASVPAGLPRVSGRDEWRDRFNSTADVWRSRSAARADCETSPRTHAGSWHSNGWETSTTSAGSSATRRPLGRWCAAAVRLRGSAVPQRIRTSMAASLTVPYARVEGGHRRWRI